MSRRLTYILTAAFLGLLILGYLLFWPSPVNKKQGPVDTPKAASATTPENTQIATTTPVTTGPGDELAVPTGVTLGDDAPRKVVIRVLDKITQRMREYELDMDQSVRFGVIDVRVRTCIATPPHERPESTAFLQIDEQRTGKPKTRIYSGWMFASSPSLNPLQHPIYDVWVLKCKMSFPDKGPETVEVSAVTDEEKRGTGDALDDATGVVRKKSAKKPARKPDSSDAAASPAPSPSPEPAPAPAPEE